MVVSARGGRGWIERQSSCHQERIGCRRSPHVARGRRGTLPSRPTQAPGFRSIRTGTGSIEIAAAGNIELGNAASTIYTAGIMTEGVNYPGRGASVAELGGRMYPDRGGDIRIHAGRDVIGAPTNQLVTDWLWRVGAENDNPASSLAPAWTVNFGRFMQNVAALGGGDVEVDAGGRVVDLSVASVDHRPADWR